jgi:hypothetical protein
VSSSETRVASAREAGMRRAAAITGLACMLAGCATPDGRITRLEARVAALEADAQAAGVPRARGGESVGQQTSYEVLGRVTRVDRERDFVVVELPETTHALVGDVYDIVRGADFVGELTLDSAHRLATPPTAVGHMTLKNLGREPVVGDVMTKLGGRRSIPCSNSGFYER